MLSIGEFLKQKRVEANVSQQRLAEHLGYREHSTIWRKETGRLNWSLSDAISFAGLLEMRVSELLREWEDNGSR